MSTPKHKNPCPGGHEIYHFGRPFHGHFYYTLRLSEPCPGEEKKILKKFINLTLLPQNCGGGVGSWSLQLYLVSYVLNLVKIGSVVHEEKTQKKTTHDGRQSIAKGQPSDSDDVTTFLWKFINKGP